MHNLLQREYLSRNDCRKILDKANGLSRREIKAISSHLHAIFDIADHMPQSEAHNGFMYPTDDQPIRVHFKRAIGGNDMASISRDTLLTLMPSLTVTEAPPPAPAEPHGPLSYVAIALKSKDELAPQWKTLNDLPALLQKEAARVDRQSVYTRYSRICIGQLAHQFSGETGTVNGIECHKYKSHRHMTIAIHEDSIPKLFEYLEQTVHRNGHRSVQSRLNNHRASLER